MKVDLVEMSNGTLRIRLDGNSRGFKKMVKMGYCSSEPNEEGCYEVKAKMNIELVYDLVVKEAKASKENDCLKTKVVNGKRTYTVCWIEEWRKLFPRGLNEYTNRLYKGNLNECNKKMFNFLSRSDYEKEIIFKATKYALSLAERNDYRYFPQAHYFIEKDGTSMLGQYCELIKDGDENLNSTDINKTIL